MNPPLAYTNIHLLNGIHINVILQNLILQKHLSQKMNELEDNSYVYETSSKCYKIVDYINLRSKLCYIVFIVDILVAT